MANLYIDRKATELTLNNEVLVIYENGERIGTIPLAPITRIYVKSDVKFQASLLAKLGEKNIGVIFLLGRKNTATLFYPQPHNDAARRLSQYAVAQDESFCLDFTKIILGLKLQGKLTLINELIQNKPNKCPLSIVNHLKFLIPKLSEKNTLAELRGIEGKAASYYFSALHHLLPSSLGFTHRVRRPPTDPFNALLSLSYTIAHSEFILALYGAGLDPYIGFFHSLDYGRESLACDLIEPLRPIIDRWVIQCFEDNKLTPEHFSQTSSGCFLGKEGRIIFYQAIENVITEWRKIMENNCYDLAKLLSSQTELTLPQRKTISTDNYSAQSHSKINLTSYYFNQCTLLNITL